MKTFYGIVRTLALSLFLLGTMQARGQVDVHFSRYWALPGYYHAASSGQSGRLSVYGAYVMQSADFSHAPRRMAFGADIPFRLLGRQHGAGIGYYNDGEGYVRTTRIWGQYAYRHRLRGRTQLGIGFRVGTVETSFDPAHTYLGRQDSLSFSASMADTVARKRALDLGLSLYLSNPRYFVGLSAQHLTSPRLPRGGDSIATVHPMLYFTAGYNIPAFHPLLTIQPSCHWQSNFHGSRLDVTGRVLYTLRSKVLSGGVGYSTDRSVTFSLGLAARSFSVGYAYERFTSGTKASRSIHELVLGAAFDVGHLFKKKSRGLHKSVRIL